MKEKLFMIDIETTGTDNQKDEILEVALVQIEFRYPFWFPTGKIYHRTLHYAGQPETPFAKQHMKALYEKCNAIDPLVNYDMVRKELQTFLHGDKPAALSLSKNIPKYFMGWNASNFDIPFMFVKNLLTASYYETMPDGKEELGGDVHYRIYEQTGSLQIVSDMSGLDRKTLERLAPDINPVPLPLPEGKLHDALYDCYSQINMQNGLIQIGRKAIQK